MSHYRSELHGHQQDRLVDAFFLIRSNYECMYFSGVSLRDGKHPQALSSAVPQDDSTGGHQPTSSSEATSNKHHRHDRVSRYV